MYIICILYVHYMYIICILHVYYMWKNGWGPDKVCFGLNFLASRRCSYVESTDKTAGIGGCSWKVDEGRNIK